LAGSFRLLLIFWLAAGLGAGPSSAYASAAAMKAPPGRTQTTSVQSAAGTTSDPLLSGAIRFFQEYISPVDGDRCQFSPTCSAFGRQSLRTHGPWLGLLMTTDRLMRCNYWTDAMTYPQLPNGRLVDPVAANLGGE
jgi:putative membrane protein insertion efficiency factor